MKTIYALPLTFILSARVLGQQQTSVSSPTTTSEASKPVPLSASAQGRIAKMASLFDGKTLDGWVCATNAWTVKDGAMVSLGAGREVIYTQREYSNYRLIFTMRHVSGQPDHQACVLIYGTTPPAGQKGLDALGAIQFQPPNGGHWDYRPGHNNAGKEFFTKLPHPKFDPHEWSQVELLVNTNGTASMAVAQPVGTRAVEVLMFNDATAGKPGPIAWQMHNKGLFDEYKDVRIEQNPTDNKLITTE
jgi:3-keto-disaccharide hydrolase